MAGVLQRVVLSRPVELTANNGHSQLHKERPLRRGLAMSLNLKIVQAACARRFGANLPCAALYFGQVKDESSMTVDSF
jgi:hypothetical protein